MLRFLIKVRILPITILIAGLMLTVKLGDVADSVGGIKAEFDIAKVHAQQPTAQSKGPASQSAQPQPSPQAQGQQNAPPPAEAKTGEGTPAANTSAQSDSPADPANDPTLLTQSEIDLLQQLAERREQLDKRAQEMTVREGLLKAAEQRIDKKIQELHTLQAAIDALVKKHDEQEEQRIQSLVKIYENMKPKDAGRIFEQLDMDTLLQVAEKMKERKLAPIMANMNPQKAKEITEMISNGRRLPVAGAQAGG